MPPTFSEAYATPSAAPTSKPISAPLSTPSAPTSLIVPTFGGACVTSRSVCVLMSYSVVDVVPLKLREYAAPEMSVDVNGVSTVTPPVVGLTRRFWPFELTIRRRSTCGLKSTPKLVPDSATLSAATVVEAARSYGVDGQHPARPT